MVIQQALKDLKIQRAKIERTIAQLEDLQRRTTPAKRGRKGMSREERLRVSDRMRKYWAARRVKSAGSEFS